MARVELRGVAKVYPGGIEAVRALDLTVEDGALFVIVGPSGSGKSTLLRLIAGLEPLSAGSLWIDGRRVDALAPRDRDVAMVFQTPVVYPFLSVFENLAFGLRARGTPRSEVERAVAEAAGVLGLGELLGRRPGTLSGGQRQRVALGRALVRRPRVFLLDEPFSSLDAPLRAAIRAELIDLHRRLGTTMIHVTHDQGEALALGYSDRGPERGPDRSDRRTPGRLRASGLPVRGRVHREPADERPSLPGRGRGAGHARHPDRRMRPTRPPGRSPKGRAGPRSLVQRSRRADRSGNPRRACPHGRSSAGPDDTALVARTVVRRLEPHGADTLATLALGPHALAVRLAPRTPVGVGDPLAVALDPAGIVWFDPDTGRALSLSPDQLPRASRRDSLFRESSCDRRPRGLV